MTPIQRSALCAAIASINAPHIQFWGEHNKSDIAPYTKFLTKIRSYLAGELKSQANLLRFHDEFYAWREQQQEEDSLAYRIQELCNAALHSAVESLFDPECNDLALVEATLTSCWEEMDELGAETSDLRHYWSDIKKEVLTLVSDRRQIPLPKEYFTLLKESDVSLFGLGA